MSLDDYHRCAIAGCQWHVYRDEERCVAHGGRGIHPEVRTDEWGKTTWRLSDGTLVASDEVR